MPNLKMDALEDAQDQKRLRRAPTMAVSQILSQLLHLPASSHAEAQAALLQAIPQLPARSRIVAEYVLTSEGMESQLEKRGGGISLRYILWWLRTHAREYYLKAATAALTHALAENWPLTSAYEPLSFVPEVRRHLPPLKREFKQFDEQSGLSFVVCEGICVVVDTEDQDRFREAVHCGGQVYLRISADGVHLRVDGRSGLPLPKSLTPPDWTVRQTTSHGRPVYLHRASTLPDEDIDKLFTTIVDSVDRRWKDPHTPALLGAKPVVRTK